MTSPGARLGAGGEEGRAGPSLPSPLPSPQLVQGPGTARVLLPWLPGPGRSAPEHHRQRHQRGHLHVCGAPAAARAQHLLLAHPRAELSAALRAEAADKALCLLSLLALSWEGGRLLLHSLGGEPAQRADHWSQIWRLLSAGEAGPPCLQESGELGSGAGDTSKRN